MLKILFFKYYFLNIIFYLFYFIYSLLKYPTLEPDPLITGGNG
jgi:hypothetical protein